MTGKNTTVADLLKKTRLDQKLSIKDIAAEICVSSSYLHAIENGDYDKLPEQTFAVGFVKAYASALGLNSMQVADTFKMESGLRQDAALTLPQLQAEEVTQRKISSWLSPIAGLVGASFCWVLFGVNIGLPHAPNSKAPFVAEEVAQLASVQANLYREMYQPAGEAVSGAINAVVSTGSDTLSDASGATGDNVISKTFVPENTEVEPSLLVQKQDTYKSSGSFLAPAAHASEADTSSITDGYVVIEAQEDSWLRLAHSDGTEVWSGVLREGETYQPSGEKPLVLSTSNAGGVLLSVDGVAITLGGRGVVVSDLKLDHHVLVSALEPVSGPSFGSR